MALTRKLLKGLGLSDEQIETIIDAHSETVDGLKEARDGYKADAEKLSDVQKQLDDLKKTGGDWQQKYEAEKGEHDRLKQEIADKATKATKESAFRQLLKDCNISEKRIETIVKASGSVIDGMELGDDGKPAKAEELKANIIQEWDDFRVTTTTTGATVTHPPANSGNATLTKADIYKRDEKGRYVMTTAERQKALAENPNLLN
jgi:response regulator of citrate/malate metabolism